MPLFYRPQTLIPPCQILHGTSSSYSDVLHKSDEVAGDAKTLGAKFVRVAPLSDCQPFTEAITLRTAEEFNRIGKLYREKHGLIYCYHNHGCEFVLHGSGTLFDLLID